MAKIGKNEAERLRQLERRAIVSTLRTRGYTILGIVQWFAKPENKWDNGDSLVNPKTGKTFCYATIHKDVQAIEEEWKKYIKQECIRHKARQLAELAQVKKSAFTCEELNTVVNALTLEMKLLGTDATKPQIVVQQNIEPPKIGEAKDPIEASKIYQQIMGEGETK